MTTLTTRAKTTTKPYPSSILSGNSVNINDETEVLTLERTTPLNNTDNLTSKEKNLTLEDIANVFSSLEPAKTEGYVIVDGFIVGNINPPQFPSPTSIENENNEVSPAPYARTTESVPDTTHNGTWSWMDVTKREQLANMPVSSSFNPIRGPMLPQITAKDLITDLVSRRPSPTVPMSTFSITRTKLPSEGFELQDESATEFGPLQTFQQVTSKNGQILFTSQSLSTNSGGTGPQTVPTIPTESDSPSMNENQIEDHEHHPNHDESHHHDHDHHHEHGDHDHGHNHEHDSHGHGHEGHEHDHSHHDHHDHDHHFTPSNLPKVALPQGPSESLGLTASTSHLTRAERAFVDVNNNLGFQFYRNLLKEHGQENMVFSPISTSTSLAMIFLGSRGNTSWQLNEILRLDEMISFNPHLMFKNITDTLAESTESITSACLKALLVDKVSGLLKSILVALRM